MRWIVKVVGVVALTVGVGCAASQPTTRGRLVLGVVAYEEGQDSLARYDRFRDYLSERTHAIVEVEPAFNELKAIERIENQSWSMVFAPPGLAAIAIAKAQYEPLFPLQGSNSERAVIVVAEDSPIQSLTDLNGTALALGQPGSATGYYLPLYDLYGLTFSEIQFAPTPETVLTWIDRGEVEAGALSRSEFDRFSKTVASNSFRVLHSSRNLPSGVVMVGPNVERLQLELLRKSMNEAAPALAAEAGYVPNAKTPNYRFFLEIVEKVTPIEASVRDRPARLFATSPSAKESTNADLPAGNPAEETEETAQEVSDP